MFVNSMWKQGKAGLNSKKINGMLFGKAQNFPQQIEFVLWWLVARLCREEKSYGEPRTCVTADC